jgi:hypothetical protein
VRRPVAVWLAGYGLLLLAWVGANPPGSAPDEPAHHVKAVATAGGQLTGPPLADLSWAPPIRRPFLARVMQTFRIPARLAADPRWACNAFTPESAACLRATRPQQPAPAPDGTVPQDSILGPYPPAPYLILGAMTKVSADAGTALYAERLAGAAVSFALLTLAAVLATGRWVRVALMLAVTPAVLFASSVVGTSGIEITAAVAHAAAVLSLAERPIGQGPWRAWAVSGVVLVLTRPLGLLWLTL